MNTHALYHEILSKLKNGQRPRLSLSTEQVGVLKKDWQRALEVNPIATEELTQIFCILDHSQHFFPDLQELFVATLQKQIPDDLIIYALSASQKHVIEESLRSGNMIPLEYFDVLRMHLKSEQSEVLEWTLRTIESMGVLSLRLQKEVRASRPGAMKFFNKHLKASAQIIDLLEQQWERMRP